jgi:hypothetical protein
MPFHGERHCSSLLYCFPGSSQKTHSVKRISFSAEKNTLIFVIDYKYFIFEKKFNKVGAYEKTLNYIEILFLCYVAVIIPADGLCR